MELTHFSLFSGIGGIDLASEWAGFKTVGQCELADYPYRILCKHWPDVPKWRDIRDVTAETIRHVGPIKLISAGYPCQPFSLAGKREGERDDRHLWPEVYRLLKEINPTWFIGENVVGHVTMGLDTVLSDLEGINYTCQPFIIPACASNAVDVRERVFVLAHSPGTQCTPGTEVERILRTLPENRTIIDNPDGPSEAQSGEDVANSAGEGLSKCGPTGFTETREEEKAGMVTEFERCSKDVANTNRTGQQKFNPAAKSGFAGYDTGSINKEWATRPTKSGLGLFTPRTSIKLVGRRLRGEIVATKKKANTRTILLILREKAGEKDLQREIRGTVSLQEKEILRPNLFRDGFSEGQSNSRSIKEKGGCVERRQMRGVPDYGEFGSSPQEWRSLEQLSRQCKDIVWNLSHEMALEAWEKRAEETVGVQNLWRVCTEIGYVPKTLSEVQALWQSLSYQEKSWVIVRACGRIPWPAGLGQAQYEWEPPRVATGIKNRANRLKALGNMVVPAQVYPILKAIHEIESRC